MLSWAINQAMARPDQAEDFQRLLETFEDYWRLLNISGHFQRHFSCLLQTYLEFVFLFRGAWKYFIFICTKSSPEAVTSRYIAGTSLQSSRIFGHQGIKALPRCKPPLSTCPPTPSTLRPQQWMYGRLGRPWYMGGMSGHVSCRPMAAPFLPSPPLLSSTQSPLSCAALQQCNAIDVGEKLIQWVVMNHS